MMNVSRRRFVHGAGLAGLGLLPGCVWRPGQATLERPLPRIGWLHGAVQDSYTQTHLDAFREGLQALGYVEGQNIHVDYRWADGYSERLPMLAAELAHVPVDVFVVQGVAGTRAAKMMTSTIPIVMGTSTDPVGSGLVESLARPGGNVTGLAAFLDGVPAKRLDLLKDTLLGVPRVGVLAEANAPFGLTQLGTAAQTLGLELVTLEVHGPEGFDTAFEQATRAGIDALLTLEHTLIIAYRPRIVEFAARSHLPGIYSSRIYVQDGGLMGYGPDLAHMWRRAAYYVDRIVKGAKPADLPVEQPREFEFVINLRTAQALGLTIPQHVLLQATEVIQ
jgi:putative ABC transport system substrate-binding protein